MDVNAILNTWKLHIAVIVFILLIGYMIRSFYLMLSMPGDSFGAPYSPPNTQAHLKLKNTLKAHVAYLSKEIGPRNVHNPKSLHRAKDYIVEQLSLLGLEAQFQTYKVKGYEFTNIYANKEGQDTSKHLVLGAHYDSVPNCPGANDNASGVAGLLALAKLYKDTSPKQSIMFAFFVNEEPPYFQTKHMGSLHFAKYLKKKDFDISLMISLETIGYYSDEPHSQVYPMPFGLFYPSTGNYIGIVGNLKNEKHVKSFIKNFRATTPFPSEGGAMPSWIPGVAWSDHWSFWKQNYPAIMITDTALYRYPHYHLSSDTMEHINFDRMSTVVKGIYDSLNNQAE